MTHKAETVGRFGASILRRQLSMEERELARAMHGTRLDREQENPEMNTYERLEAEVKARGVRVAERLEILRVLQSQGGAEQLTQAADQHQHAIEAAARQVREALR